MVCFGFVSFTLTTCRFPLALGRTPLSLTLCKCYKFRLDFSNETPRGCFVEHYPPSRLFYLFPFSDSNYHAVYTKMSNSRFANCKLDLNAKRMDSKPLNGLIKTIFYYLLFREFLTLSMRVQTRV
jgi:hypothetical protein